VLELSDLESSWVALERCGAIKIAQRGQKANGTECSYMSCMFVGYTAKSESRIVAVQNN
jgi:hypothetical protein